MNQYVKLLQEGKIIIVKIGGNSMKPHIQSKQRVQLSPTTWKEVNTNDIVYCRVRGKYYLHYVIAKNERRGCQIANASGHVNGWTKQVYGLLTAVLED